MLKKALVLTKQLKKKTNTVSDGILSTYNNEEGQLAILGAFIFQLMNKLNIEKELSKSITDTADKQEAKNKDKAIKETLEYNRSLENPKIFYLASEHNDSALDHAPWQGKIYIDEKWESVISNQKLKDEIFSYILKHDIKTYQWVIGKPVWFATRPNCRHYFKALYTDEVLKISREKLIEFYDMHTAIGDRQYLQTLRHSTSRAWYQDIRNAQLILEAYRERFRLHSAMYRKNSTNLLCNAIQKDKLLIKRWREYLRLHNGLK